MDRYYFSGSLTQQMHDYLIAMPDFKPLDILISQLDKSAITKLFSGSEKASADPYLSTAVRTQYILERQKLR